MALLDLTQHLYAPATAQQYAKAREYVTTLTLLMSMYPAQRETLLEPLTVCLAFCRAYRQGRATVNGFADVWTVVNDMEKAA